LGTTQQNEHVDGNSSYRDWFRAVLQTQREGLLQAQDDRRAAREERQAASARIARLEEAVILLAMKSETAQQAPQTTTSRVDLQKFRTSDGPTFHGPFQEVKPFLRWINGVQIFFNTKGVNDSADKIWIIGSLIGETNLLAFYANESRRFVNKSWEEFQARMFSFALPPLWQTDLKKQIRHLAMRDTKTFMGYSTRARTLQHMLNFEKESISDFELAEYLTFGLTSDLEACVDDHQLLRAVPFVYSNFESRVAGFFRGVSKSTPTNRPRANSPSPPSGRTPCKDFIWRIHAYLDSQGRCHFCKKTCGSMAGACPGPVDRSLIEIPPSFKAPPKPANYIPPKAWGGSQKTAGKPVQPPAGRAPGRAATVAAVAETNYFLELDAAAIAAIAAIDKELELSRNKIDEDDPYPTPESALVASLMELHHDSPDPGRQSDASETMGYVSHPPVLPQRCPQRVGKCSHRRYHTGHHTTMRSGQLNLPMPLPGLIRQKSPAYPFFLSTSFRILLLGHSPNHATVHSIPQFLSLPLLYRRGDCKTPASVGFHKTT
jgi:hypothetical protein